MLVKDNPPRRSLKIKKNAEKLNSVIYADHLNFFCDERSIYYVFNIFETVDISLILSNMRVGGGLINSLF